MIGEDMLTVKDLENYLKIGTTVAYKLIHEDGFPAIRISPRRVLIPKTALDEWCKKRFMNGGYTSHD